MEPVERNVVQGKAVAVVCVQTLQITKIIVVAVAKNVLLMRAAVIALVSTSKVT